MKPLFWVIVCLLPAGEGMAQSDARERIVQSIVPWLDYNSSCWSAVELKNLGDREVSAEVEAHKSSGALAALVGRTEIQVSLPAGEHAEYKLQLPEESTGAWVRVREKIPARQLSPILAVSGATVCLVKDEVHTTVREVAWPVRNPWFSADVSQGDDGIIALINTSLVAAQFRDGRSQLGFGGSRCDRDGPDGRSGTATYSERSGGEDELVHAIMSQLLQV